MENQRVKKAQKFLNSAKVLLEHGDYDSCISRCYYALFHIVIALLEKFGIRQKKWEHRFVWAAFNKEFVHGRKMFSPAIFQVIRDTFYDRMDADYEIDGISHKKAKRILDKIENLFNSIYRELNNEKQ